jgi:hypothetical protein
VDFGLADGLKKYAIIFPYCGPGGGVILKFHPDGIAVVQSFTINHVPACRFFVPSSYHYLAARLPGVSRKYASAACADVIGVCPLFSIGTRTLVLFSDP